MPVARPGGGHRAIVKLQGPDARAYRQVVAPLTPRIERWLGSGVHANRAMGRGALTTTRLEPWLETRERWDREIRAIDRGVIVRADVAVFYASVGERALTRALGDDAEGVLRLLRAFWDDGVTGLPVGPEASAILANAVLAPVDEALRRAGVAPRRWVDDWVVPVPSRRAGGRTLLTLERALGDIGLQLNLAKTGLEGPVPSGRPAPVSAAPAVR